MIQISKSFRKDLRGQRFGKLVVTSFVPVPEDSKTSYWDCQCDCGDIHSRVRGTNLISGATTSCGCKDATDYLGKTYGSLTIVKYDKEMTKKYEKKCFICNCICGNIKSIRLCHLKTGAIVSCGCSKTVDLTNQRSGKLTAIKSTDQRTIKGSVIWECLCNCGNTCYISSGDFNRTQSCGCIRGGLDLIGQRFGLLTVLKRTEQRTNNQGVIWKCLCDCGGTHYVASTHLIRNAISSCGCIKSKGELLIKNCLNENHIDYRGQYSFDNLISDKNRLLKFDFGILGNNNSLKYLIEFDGIQHFYYTTCAGWNTKENFEGACKNDRIKNQYCINNNITLIRIPYWEINNICLEWLIPETSNKEFLVNNIDHNKLIFQQAIRNKDITLPKNTYSDFIESNESKI